MQLIMYYPVSAYTGTPSLLGGLGFFCLVLAFFAFFFALVLLWLNNA